MELMDLYYYVLVFVLVAVVTAIGIVLLVNMGNTSGITTAANTSIQAFATALGTIGTNWASLLVLIVVFAVILGLIFRSFLVGAIGGGHKR